MATAIAFVDDAMSTGRKGYVCVTGVHGVMEAVRSREFRAVLDDALLVTPDGMPTVWIAKYQKHASIERVFGPDLMTELCGHSLARGYTHFLYGGKSGVVEELRYRLERRWPTIKVVGTFTPPFRALTGAEKSDLEGLICRLKPDIIWVGLSTPKQELFMAEMIDRLDCKLMVGVGAAFDIHTGRAKDAPSWMKKSGLQWFHRLCQEPSRLWKRYLINNSAFLWHLALNIVGLKRYALTPELTTDHGTQ